MVTEWKTETLLENIRRDVLPKFVSPIRKKELLEREAVLSYWLDLSLCYYLPLPQFSDGDSQASLLLTKALLRELSMTREELFDLAVSHLADLSVISPFEELLSQLSSSVEGHILLSPSAQPCQVPIWYVSIASRSFGAAAILCDGVRDRLCSLLGEHFYVLPSSVHEVLCIPCDGKQSGELSHMVREINASFVDPRDRLSDHVYLCRGGVTEIPCGPLEAAPALRSNALTGAEL